MSQSLVNLLNEEATRRWSSVPTHVRELLSQAANLIEDLEAQLRTERDLNAPEEIVH